METGRLVELQVNRACSSLATHDIQLADEVRDTESKLNRLEVNLDDERVGIIARRQPTAGDLRAVVSVMKLITELERIGSEADRIAKMALSLVAFETPVAQCASLRQIPQQVRHQLCHALDAFARLVVESALRIIEDDYYIDRAYTNLVQAYVLGMQSAPENTEQLVALM
jgi:phosphate transport system protein